MQKNRNNINTEILYLWKNLRIDGHIKKHGVLIPAKKSWVRHDEHYHVDFNVKCQ